MNTSLLFYKIQKGTVSTGDYISWSRSLLEEGISSPALTILSSCSSTDNIFEIESYFRRSLEELQIEQPTFEAGARARIESLAMKIMESEDDHRQIYHLADRIFKMVIELNYPADLVQWIQLTDLTYRVDYNYDHDVISEIKKEARLLLDYRRNEK